MYAICSTKKEDVARCISEMVSNEYRLPVIQFGAKKYRELEKGNPDGVLEACRKVQGDAEHVINLDTRKIHKKGCHRHGKKIVGARIISVKSTGLINCMICMK